MVDPSQRASDADRDKVVADLRQHLVDGRLTLEEFTDRVGTTLAARTHGELAVVVTDLPTRGSTAPAVSRRSLRLTGAALGHAVRRGRIRLARRPVAFAGFADLDLREATVEHEDTVVTAIVGDCGDVFRAVQERHRSGRPAIN